ncbi:MAG: hypothetical protein NTV74_03780 [Euryarchaeota archaeon]|nr:hypothetical protein [Euryarchaeota archaeon]
MKNMKKTIFCMIAVAITTLLITSTLGMAITPSNDTQSNKIKINKINIAPEHLSTISKKVDIVPTVNPNPKAANLAFPGLHPGFGRSIGGTMFASYYEPTSDEIIWTYSIDDGATFDAGIYYEGLGGDYPSIKLWDGERFFGTYVTDFNDLSGGPTYLYEVNDVTQLSDTTLNPLTYWPWDTYGWHDMMDADIACDNSQNTWEWGVSSYVTSTTYSGGPVQDGPFIVYADETTQGTGHISWYIYPGCAHTDIDIDPTTHYAYAVYDWYDETTTTWKLLVRVIDFTNIMTGFDTLYEIEGGGNLKNPAVAAYGDKVVILAQTDENGNDDIICLYSDDKFVTVQSSFVVDTTGNERYPDVRFDNDGNFICTYVMNNNLYALESDDGGQTWIEPRGQVNTNNDVVVEEYKTSDLGDFAVKGMWEETGMAGTEVWIGDVAAPSNLPPLTPTIDGPTKLKRYINYEFTFTTTDPDGDDISYFVDWGDGTNSSWTSPSASGTPIKIKHKWTTKAAFTIKCKAKDTNDAESGWGILGVSTPRVVMKPMIIQKILERFPHAFPILRYLLGV